MKGFPTTPLAAQLQYTFALVPLKAPPLRRMTTELNPSSSRFTSSILLLGRPEVPLGSLLRKEKEKDKGLDSVSGSMESVAVMAAAELKDHETSVAKDGTLANTSSTFSSTSQDRPREQEQASFKMLPMRVMPSTLPPSTTTTIMMPTTTTTNAETISTPTPTTTTGTASDFNPQEGPTTTSSDTPTTTTWWNYVRWGDIPTSSESGAERSGGCGDGGWSGCSWGGCTVGVGVKGVGSDGEGEQSRLEKTSSRIAISLIRLRCRRRQRRRSPRRG